MQEVGFVVLGLVEALAAKAMTNKKACCVQAFLV